MKKYELYYIIAFTAFAVTLVLLGACTYFEDKKITKIHTLSYKTDSVGFTTKEV